jgi:membrane AbrB-like protein
MRTPIPWLLGPLFALALLRIGGLRVDAPPGARYAGQWVIGTALALYFTPAVLGGIASVWYLPLAGAAFAIVVGYVAAAVLARVARIDRTTALFCSVPGGASEMATLGERFGARTDRVAAAQSMRILIVVGIVPAAFAFSGVHGSDAYAAAATFFDPARFVLLMSLTFAGGLVAHAAGVPNGFIIGPLAVGIPLTALGLELSSMPAVASNTGQLLLGCALGASFRRDFVHGASRFVAGVVVSVLAALLLCAAFGFALAVAAGQNPATMILGTAPGGIAEMAITAKALQIGVPLVTAFHVTRIVVLLLLTRPLFETTRGAWRRRRRR